MVVTRREAIAKGLKRFFTGRPCKRGHLAERDILNSHCMECYTQYLKDYYLQHREKLIQKTLKWQRDNPEKFKKKMREYMKRAYLQNPEKFRQRSALAYAKNRDKYVSRAKDYRMKNPEKVRRSVKKWRATHPELAAQDARTQTAKRRAIIKECGKHTYRDVLWIIEKQQGLCFWCGKSILMNFHVDHRIPLSKGGTNFPSNICIACPRCNQQKRAMWPEDFIKKLHLSNPVQANLRTVPFTASINPHFLCPSI